MASPVGSTAGSARAGAPRLECSAQGLWEALDAARLPDVALAHVKGHSGDPDNERCDAIAVAHSHGQQPAENTATSGPADPAPASLGLLTRLEVADR